MVLGFPSYVAISSKVKQNCELFSTNTLKKKRAFRPRGNEWNLFYFKKLVSKKLFSIIIELKIVWFIKVATEELLSYILTDVLNHSFLNSFFLS